MTALLHTAAALQALPRADSGTAPEAGNGSRTTTVARVTPAAVRAQDPAPRAVVMTMGALHEGHATLIRAARERVGETGQVVVTVFVNPLQFGAGEDLDRYPRTLEADLAVAELAGADAVFAPAADEVYPGGEPQVRIAAGPMGERFEGAARPGHFDGMLTVVAKLLHLTRPGLALFGQKDAQQLALVRRMARDLNFPVEIVGVPTVREPDGLAMSSRNRFLSPGDRTTALALSRALFAGRDALTGSTSATPAGVRAAARAVIEGTALSLDYLSLIDPSDFTEAADDHRGEAVLAVAARVGATRLIDNIPLTFGEPQ
ncbi:pantoate--beta-alanine ligase [Streptomyces sp. NBC_00859]|uniref:pantoate--beta-alanine ligase n=1 Tax=Streptomyces sp. NBC_00859 TaxID=2903682 RepID=UPI00386A2082|nr:pantoate--beta-alanine ligase [Streptomyces sp. NBC_00859]